MSFRFGKSKNISSALVQDREGFYFKIRGKNNIEAPPILRPVKPISADNLTGFVHGRDASDIEERFAIALDTMSLSYTFQRFVETEYTLPDQEKQVDFVVYAHNRAYPVEIYGSYFHTSAGDMLRDQVRERQLNDVFSRWGWEDLQISWDYELYDQEAANNKVRRMFL